MTGTNTTKNVADIPLTSAQMLPHLELARLRGPATPNPTPGVTASYTATLETAGGLTVPLAYVKDLTEKELLGELLGAVIGHALRLPLASTFVVAADDRQGPWKHAPKVTNSDDRILFASSAISPSATLLSYVQTLQGIAFQNLVTWTRLPGAVAFDEWVANVDRHAGNLLVSGGAEFWLIDHSHILTGSNWLPANLQTQSAELFSNQLSTTVSAVLTPDKKAQARKSAQAEIEAHKKLPISEYFASFPINKLLSNSELGIALAFLQQRLNHTADMLATRF